MPDHVHIAGSSRRRPTDKITLHDAAEELWEKIAEREAVEYDQV
jgi:hypothetical protein